MIIRVRVEYELKQNDKVVGKLGRVLNPVTRKMGTYKSKDVLSIATWMTNHGRSADLSLYPVTLERILTSVTLQDYKPYAIRNPYEYTIELKGES